MRDGLCAASAAPRGLCPGRARSAVRRSGTAAGRCEAPATPTRAGGKRWCTGNGGPAVDEWTRERYPGVTRAELAREQQPRIRKHEFVPSGRRTYGHRICAVCDSLERDSVHRIKPVSEDVKQVEARRVGERA